jgi:hypothetical protein
MSNRIDLTQFDSAKEWDLTGFDWLAKQADSEYVANAVRQVPDLIAELKRCYKLLDDADYAMSRYGDEEEHQDIDNVADAYEAVCNALAGQGR